MAKKEPMTAQTNTLIIGASISGLAAAACLQAKGVSHLIIEKQDSIAAPWRHHYERLHLHTNKRLSNLPFKKFESDITRYPSRQQVVDYLEAYAQSFNIQPLFNTEALLVKREESGWITQTNKGVIHAQNIIVATGAYGKPRAVQFNGMEHFTGRILHSCDYTSGRAFTKQKVLVIGFGNSACEIAIDLYEQGAMPAMSVRSAINIVPRDVLGIPVLELSLLLNRLSPALADTISAPLMRLLTGRLIKLGLTKMPYGPLEQIRKEGKAPVLDIGVLQHIRSGHIKIYDGIANAAGNTIYFNNGTEADVDAVVAAIGYTTNAASLVMADKSRFEDLRVPISKQKYFGKDGLYFCGFWISPTGQIREISRDAKKIAEDIALKSKARSESGV